jgi:hypothetical protein
MMNWLQVVRSAAATARERVELFDLYLLVGKNTSLITQKRDLFGRRQP